MSELYVPSAAHPVAPKLNFIFNIASQVHVAGANTVHWDLFNAGAKFIRVFSIRQKPNIVTAVTGIAFAWKLARTTAVGTGGTAQTALLPDSRQYALDPGVTCRSKPTGGATEGVIINNYDVSSEETNTGAQAIAAAGGLEILPQSVLEEGLLLRSNEGLRCVQITNSAEGNTGWLINFQQLN